MKKLLTFAAVAALALNVCAQDVDDEDDVDVDGGPAVETVEDATAPKKVGIWPACIAVAEIPTDDIAPDVIGLRITIPFSTRQESVTGIDIGFWGRTKYFEGLMFNILRNDVKDQLSGLQFGIYNSAAQCDIVGAQFGLWNEAGSMRGVQCGLVNVGGQMSGLQVGLINRCEEMYGFQVGIINVIRDAEIRFCPFINIGF